MIIDGFGEFLEVAFAVCCIAYKLPRQRVLHDRSESLGTLMQEGNIVVFDLKDCGCIGGT